MGDNYDLIPYQQVPHSTDSQRRMAAINICRFALECYPDAHDRLAARNLAQMLISMLDVGGPYSLDFNIGDQIKMRTSHEWWTVNDVVTGTLSITRHNSNIQMTIPLTKVTERKP